MKKSLVLIILFLMSILIVGCVNTPNGPDTSQPYGYYNNETMYSMYPYYVSSRFSDSAWSTGLNFTQILAPGTEKNALPHAFGTASG